jgi:hypothetical protein
MQHSKGFDGKAITHDRPYHSIAAILAIAKPIAVLDVHVPSGDGSFPWPDHVLNADVFTENLSTPAVVIACDPKDLDTGISQLGECGKRSEAAARNHRLPFEPEVEQIAVDYQGPRFTGKTAQERNERPLYLGTRDAQVRVRHDVAWGVEHGSN